MPQELKTFEKFSYGVGHVLNDLCASMWFSYLLVFFHDVLQFSNSMAGNILLVGQLADGIATPFVGYESDHSNITCRYGRRKSWHLVGTISVALTFPLLYMSCIGCNSTTAEYAQFIYYAPLVVIFQFGWASTQINHLALIPDLTTSDGERVTLNAIRYTFTVLSSIFVYGVAWVVLDVPSSPSSKQSDLSPDDAPVFRNLVLIVVGTGILFSLLFHIGLKEDRTIQHTSHQINASDDENEDQIIVNENSPLISNQSKVAVSTTIQRWHDWFKQPSFYQMAILYMCTRLVVNLSQVYIPMFLMETLKLHKKYIAIVPLVVYVCSFLAALLVRPITIKLSQELLYFTGGLFVLGACTWSRFIPEGDLSVFGMAVLLGMGTSVILVMSLSMTAKLIGKAKSTGAFVYGAMSFTDKVSNGAAVIIIQNLNPCLCECNLCSIYFRNVMSYVIGGIMLFALITLFILSCNQRSKPQVIEVQETEVTPSNEEGQLVQGKTTEP